MKLRQRGLRTALPSIHLANLRSLPNKMDELLLLSLTNKEFSNSASLCFTETWLNDTIPDSTLPLTIFQLIRADREAESTGKSRGSRTCFYINESWCIDVTVLKMMCCPIWKCSLLTASHSICHGRFVCSFSWVSTFHCMRSWDQIYRN